MCRLLLAILAVLLSFGWAQAQQTGLEWDGTGSARRMLYWDNPFPIYPATYIWRVLPHKKQAPSDSPTGYYTTMFWGNNGNFVWDGGNTNTYYGFHPYPVPPPNGQGHWEISVFSNDYVVASEVQWDRWFTQAVRVWFDGTTFHHEFYYDWPDTTKLISQDIQFPTWSDRNPPHPSIMMGQAPDLCGPPPSTCGQSWGGYPGWEEFKGVIRGIQFYSGLLSLADIASEVNTPKSSANGFALIWYLNTDPTPTDVTDKKGVGVPHDPMWDGTTATLWTDGSSSPGPGSSSHGPHKHK